jgi:hypothetical protein
MCARWLAAAALVGLLYVSLATPSGAQGSKPHTPPAQDPSQDPSQYEDEPRPPQSQVLENPAHAFEFELGGDGLWFGYRSGQQRGNGYVSAAFFAGDDDDYAATLRLMRFGEPSGESPFGFGIGLGAFGARVDESDSEVGAITVTGAVDFQLDEWFVLDYRIRVGGEVSYAPDQATFADGRRVLDLLGRVEVDLSAWATAFVGYRHLEVDIDGDPDAELDSAFHLGVRLGF